MLFKKYHIKLILEGKKTQTRRTGKRRYKVGRTYRIQRQWFKWTDIKILITRRFEQRLGDISPTDTKKEGYRNIWEFVKAWEEIHGPGSWNTDQIVTVYEFKVVEGQE